MSKSTNNKFLIVVIVTMLVVGLAIAAVAMQKNGLSSTNKQQSNQSPANEINQNAKDKTSDQKVPENLPQGISSNTLSAKSGKSGSATYFVVSPADNSTIAVEAKLPELSGSNFYQAWLTDAKDNKENLPLGKFQNQSGTFRLSAAGMAADFKGYKKIVVSEESVDDNTIETVILEGDFKN